MKRLLFAACAVALFLPSIGNAQPVTAQCRTDNTAVATDNGNIVGTVSTDFAPVPSLSVTITTQGAVADCIVVNFAGSIKTTLGTDIGTRVYVDRKPLGRPPAVRIANTQHSGFESGSAVFVIPNVSKGDHTVEIWWRLTDASGTAQMRNRSIEVLYKGQ